MRTHNVQSSDAPVEICVNQIGNGVSEIWIRDNIHKEPVNDPEGGEMYVYDEVFCIAEHITADEISADLEAWKAYASEWRPTPDITTRVEIAEAKIDYLMMMGEMLV